MEIQSKTIPKKVSYEPAEEDIEPTGLRYEEVKPLAIDGNIRDMVFTPSNGQEWIVSSSSKLVRIPLNTSGFLIPKESYLSFKVSPQYRTAVPAGVNASFNNTAHAIIRNLRIIGPGNERLEDIQEYNVLYEIFRSMQVSGDYRTTSERIKSGRGLVMTTHATNDYANEYEMTIHLLSGLFLSEKYIPVGFLREPIILEIDLEIGTRCMTAAGATVAGDTTNNFKIKDIEFHGMILDMGPTYEDQFKRMLIENNGIEWSSLGYSLTTAAVNGGTTANINCTLPFHSLKSIVFMNRISTDDVVTSNYLTFRVSNSISQYRWRVGGRQFPDSGAVIVNSGISARAFTELQRCFGVPSKIDDGGLITTLGDYTGYYSATATDERSFMIGIDLETYNEDSSIIRSGMDTTKGQTMQLQLNGRAAFNASTVCNFYGIYDVVFYLSPTGELKAVY